MATYNIQQGESRFIEIAIYEDNIAVDLSVATDIKVVLYSGSGTTAGPKFGLNVEVGYGLLTVGTSPNQHIINIELTRANTNALLGDFYADVVTNEPSLDLTDGLQKEYIRIPMGTITSGGFVNNETLV